MRGKLIYKCRRCGQERSLVLVPNVYAALNVILDKLSLYSGEDDRPRLVDVMPCKCTPDGMAVGDFVAFEIEAKEVIPMK